MENKIKHLEMIEKIIERMEKNSFSLKGWTITLVVAICALSAKDSEKQFILVALLPILIFWLLDSFYLQIEKKYRIIYKNVSKKKEEEIDFDLDISNAVFTSNVNFVKCLFSFSETLFYLPLVLSMVTIIYLLKIF